MKAGQIGSLLVLDKAKATKDVFHRLTVVEFQVEKRGREAGDENLLLYVKNTICGQKIEVGSSIVVAFAFGDASDKYFTFLGGTKK